MIHKTRLLGDGLGHDLGGDLGWVRPPCGHDFLTCGFNPHRGHSQLGFIVQVQLDFTVQFTWLADQGVVTFSRATVTGTTAHAVRRCGDSLVLWLVDLKKPVVRTHVDETWI